MAGRKWKADGLKSLLRQIDDFHAQIARLANSPISNFERSLAAEKPWSRAFRKSRWKRQNRSVLRLCPPK